MNYRKIQFLILQVILLISFLGQDLQAQDMTSDTRISQRSTIIQRIGTTDVTIVYHSPLVQGRKIFGQVVPYDIKVDGKEYPWRAGSNENTTITFTHDVWIEGKPLAAGSYGLHVYVGKKEWTFIFSHNYKSWGSFQYDPNDDALRVKVSNKKIPFQEWLSYQFTNRKAESASVELGWEEVAASFKIDVDVNANLLSDLRKKEEKTWGDLMTLAEQTLKKDSTLVDEALQFLDLSIKKEANFHNQMLSSTLYQRKGEIKKAEELKSKALSVAKDFDYYYYGLSKYLIHHNKKASEKILKDNVDKNPEDWIAHLALGEFYIKESNQKKVVEHFKKAFELSPDNWRNYARYLYLSNKIILK